MQLYQRVTIAPCSWCGSAGRSYKALRAKQPDSVTSPLIRSVQPPLLSLVAVLLWPRVAGVSIVLTYQFVK